MTEEWNPTDDDAPNAPPDKSNGHSHLAVVDPYTVADPDWARALGRSAKGVPTKDAGNAALILTRTAAWQGRLIHDVVADVVLVRNPPALPHLPEDWQSLPPPPSEVLSDSHVDYIGLWLRRMWSQSWSDTAVRRAIIYAAHQNPFDPLRDYLEKCAGAWDKTPRAATWLADYLGAERNALHLRIGSMWLLSAVARAYVPGAKVDHVLVLEGPQGKGKNRALELLFGDERYLPELPPVNDKDAMHLLGGAWCACIDELCAIRATDVEKVKSFLTRRIDRYRPPYGRDVVTRPRRTVFAATTNAPEYLTDASGNRRYWPVLCGRIRHAELERDRDQLWGEVVHMYRAGEQWWPDDSDTVALRSAQEEREQHDEWDERVRRYASAHDWVTIGDCLTDLGLEPADWRPADQHRVSRALQRAGWRPVRSRAADRPRRHWVPPTE